MKKLNIYYIVVVAFILMSFNSINAQGVGIVGYTVVNQDQVTSHLAKPYKGTTIMSGSWTITGGVIQSQTNTTATILWTTPGDQTITFLGYDTNFNLLYDQIVVNVQSIELNTHDFGNYNYVYEETLKTESTEATYNSISESNKIRNISYFDGLGRKIQDRAIGQSPLGKDIVTHTEYDNLGRQAKAYLPYTSSNNNGLFETGGQSKTISQYNISKYGNTTNPYTEKIFDGSPLNRILETGTPGTPWLANASSDNDHTIKMGYATNSATSNTYKVRWYKVTLDASYNPTLTNPSPYYYTVGSLYKTVIKDENWTPSSGSLRTTEEFKNKYGQTVLKRTYAKIGTTVTPHDTYYVYDIYNNLTYVIPPKVTTSDGVNSTELSELCYQYKYDKYNRLIEKKMPGKGWEYIVYDKMNRPIMTQDANLRTQSKWLFTKYDAFGRIVYTGTYGTSSSRISIQNYVNGLTVLNETRGSNIYNYTNNAYPVNITSSDIYTVNYYDDYIFNTNGLTLPSTIYGVSKTSNVKGLPSGTKEKVLETSGSWVTTLNAYDDKGRSIYTTSKNDFLNTTDETKIKLDFTGKTIETTIDHGSNASVSIVDKFDYDHADRLLTQKQTINSEPEELIVKNKYDELGVLENKKVGNTESIPLQTVDYKYNVRGWLTDINDVNNLGDDLFTFNIRYDNASKANAKLYNGNISEVFWKTKNSDQNLKKYLLYYDDLYRLIDAQDNMGSKYRTWAVGYDKNGNLTRLYRKGHVNSTATSFGDMDKLFYYYESNSNKLKKVLDNGNDTYGFKDGANQSIEYTYDTNGNMKTDANKGITNIDYNYLNLPTKVEFGSSKRIEYTYTASGTKLQKKVTNGSVTTTNYAGSFIYENSVLKNFSQPEGYVEVSGNTYKYIYQYTDHLGNVRLNYTNVGSRFTPSLQIREENNYYPFGLKHKGYNSGIIGGQDNFKYNGKEFQTEIINGAELQWYDYGARNYDPTVGRFFNADPLADAAAQIDKSPFAYTWNNPINMTDPDGMHPDWMDGTRAGQEMNFGSGASLGFDGFGNIVTSGYVSSSGNIHIARYEDGSVKVISPTEYNKLVDDGIKIESIESILGDPKDDIKNYERNEKIQRDNSIIVDALSNLTEFGQLSKLISASYNEWKIMGGQNKEFISSEDRLLSRAEGLLASAGVKIGTKAPYVKFVAGAIIGGLAADNIYRETLNNRYYKPRIIKHSPNYARLNIPGSPGYGKYSSGGAGAGGDW